MFQFKKIVGVLLLPHSIFLALLGAGVLMLWFGSRRRLAQAVVTFAAAGFFLLSYTGTWSFLVERMEYNYPVFDGDHRDLTAIDWIVVLGGGGIANSALPAPSQLSLQSLARLTEGIRILKSVPHAKLLLSGDTDALIMQKAAGIFGIGPEQMVIEDKARDTEQEAVEIKRIVGPDRIVLVTSAIHLPRAMALFNKLGMEPIPAPADFYIRQRSQPSTFGWGGLLPVSSGAPKSDALIHEYLGILWGKLLRRA